MALAAELEDFFRSAMRAYSWAQDTQLRALSAQDAYDRALMSELMRSAHPTEQREGLLRRIWTSLFGGAEQAGAPQQALQTPPAQAGAPQQALQTPPAQAGAPQQALQTPPAQAGAPQQALQTPPAQAAVPRPAPATPPAQQALPIPPTPPAQPPPRREVLSPPEILGVQVATNPEYRPGQPIPASQHLNAVDRIWNAALRMNRPDLGMRAIAAYWSGLQNATASSLALGLQALRSGDLPTAQRVLQQAYNLYFPSNDAVRITIDGNRLVAQRYGADGQPLGAPTPVTEQFLHDSLLMVANPLEFARLTLSREQFAEESAYRRARLAEDAAYRRELIRLREQQARDAAEERRLRAEAAAEERRLRAEAAAEERRARAEEARLGSRLNSFASAFTDVQRTLIENDTARRSVIERLARDDRRLADRLARDPALEDVILRAMDAARVAGERLIYSGLVPNARVLATTFINGIVFDGQNYYLPSEVRRVAQGRYRISIGGREVGVFDRDSATAILDVLNTRLIDEGE